MKETVPPPQFSAKVPASHAQEALDALARALDAPPSGKVKEADVAERALVALRDQLIQRLRRAADAGVPCGRELLERTNVALSLVVGVDYPVKGIKAKPLNQARDLVKDLLSPLKDLPKD